MFTSVSEEGILRCFGNRPPSLPALLEKLGAFTSPSLRTFAALVTGMIATTGKRTVTGMLTGAGPAQSWPHDQAHVFFSRTRWSPDLVSICLCHLIVRTQQSEGGAGPAS